MRTLVLAASALAAALALATPADALACRRPVVTRPTNQNAVRIAQLERQARASEQEATEHFARARQLQTKADALEEAIPASFGDAREVILARIDFLLEQAATETGRARTLRLRATELRAEAARLRQQDGSGGGWRGRTPASQDANGNEPASGRIEI